MKRPDTFIIDTRSADPQSRIGGRESVILFDGGRKGIQLMVPAETGRVLADAPFGLIDTPVIAPDGQRFFLRKIIHRSEKHAFLHIRRPRKGEAFPDTPDIKLAGAAA